MKLNNFSEIKNIISELDDYEKISILKEINSHILDYLQLQKVDIFLLLEKLIPILSGGNNKRLLMDIEKLLEKVSTNSDKSSEENNILNSLDFSDIKASEKIEHKQTELKQSVILSNKEAKESIDNLNFSNISNNNFNLELENKNNISATPVNLNVNQINKDLVMNTNPGLKTASLLSQPPARDPMLMNTNPGGKPAPLPQQPPARDPMLMNTNPGGKPAPLPQQPPARDPMLMNTNPGGKPAPLPQTNFRSTMNMKGGNLNINQILDEYRKEDFLTSKVEYESVPITEGIKNIIPIINEKGRNVLKDINAPTEIYSLLKLVDGISSLDAINEKYFAQVNQNFIFSVSTFRNIGFPSEFVINFLDKIIEMESNELISFVKNPNNLLKNKIRIKLGDLLLYMKALDNEQLTKVLDYQKAWKPNANKPQERRPLLGNIIISFELLTEKQINHALSIQKWYNSLEK
ncbi:MAG: hypothetical protein U0457_01390 [Candidatus Sericytochromatia bacterium]